MSKEKLSDTDKQFIKENYQTMTLNELAARFHCSTEPIKRAVSMMGLTKRTPMPQVGDFIGRLEIIEGPYRKKTRSGRTRTVYRVRCSCPKKIVKEVDMGNLKQGVSLSCGCLRVEAIQKTATKHGLHKAHPRLHRILLLMHDRCYKEEATGHYLYGGKGVIIADDWNIEIAGRATAIRNFQKWSLENGYAPGLTIDRISGNGNYSPDNCRWVDRVAQANNREGNVWLPAFGELKTIAQWARDPRCAVSEMGLRGRLKKCPDPTPEEAEAMITTPPRPGRRSSTKTQR